MKQVNMWLDDDVHMLLVKEAARMQLEQGKIISVAKLASILMKQSLNGKPVDIKQDDKQEPTTNPTEDANPTTSNPYSDLKF